MQFLNLAGLLMAAVTASAASAGCAPTSSDAKVLEFAWGLSDFVGGYYNSTVNSTFSSSSSNATIAAYEKVLFAFEKENTLGSEAIEQASKKAPGFSAPQCTFTFPTVNSTQTWAAWAYRIEATVTGAFIGLAGYTQSPEISFLLARLAASHSAHATLIGSKVNSTLFAQNATSLVGAYGPAQVLSTRNETGSLGQYLGSCLTAPSSPCGSLRIGPLDATPTSSIVAGTSSASSSASSSSVAKKHH
jgi:hypothetical protein